MIYVVSIILAAPVVLVLLLRPALMAADAGSRHPWHLACVLIALVADLITAHTLWLLVAGWPKKREWTISDTLERLAAPANAAHWRYKRAVVLAHWINQRSPTRAHIKVVL